MAPEHLAQLDADEFTLVEGLGKEEAVEVSIFRMRLSK